MFAAAAGGAECDAREADVLAAVNGDADDKVAHAAQLFAVFHSTGTSVSINGDAEGPRRLT